jgi:dCTP deaminase
MILSGHKIRELLNQDIFITPFNEQQLGPNSYNLKLHEQLLVYDNNLLDMRQKNPTNTLTIPADGLILEPNKLYLGRTVEHTKTLKHVPMLEGRSSIGRLGLFVHITAGFGDVGFNGFWTLEISCIQPIKIYPNVEICQIFYHTIEGNYSPYVSNKYQDNQSIQASMLYKDFEK